MMATSAADQGQCLVREDTELVEKLGGRDPCRALPGAGFGRCCRSGGAYDGVNGHYYVRDR
jgi:hypothetical protein